MIIKSWLSDIYPNNECNIINGQRICKIENAISAINPTLDNSAFNSINGFNASGGKKKKEEEIKIKNIKEKKIISKNINDVYKKIINNIKNGKNKDQKKNKVYCSKIIDLNSNKNYQEAPFTRRLNYDNRQQLVGSNELYIACSREIYFLPFKHFIEKFNSNKKEKNFAIPLIP